MLKFRKGFEFSLTLINRQPVGDEQHEVLKNRFEVAVTWDGNGAVDDSANESPHEAGNALRHAGKQLKRERDGVDIRAIVGNNGKGEHDQAELSEPAQRGNNNGCEKSTDARRFVSIYIDI